MERRTDFEHTCHQYGLRRAREEAERREEAAAKAVAAKNAAAEQRAALRGDAGVLAGLEATVATGSLDDPLSFRIVWFALVVGGIRLVGAIIGRLFGGGR